MKYFIWLLVAALVVLHQDFWLWDNDRLLFGFMPIGLAYHMGISIAAATTWLLACRFAWPYELEQQVEAEAKKGAHQS